MILGRVLNAASDVVNEVASRRKKSEKIIRGTVILVKKNVLAFNALHTTVVDSVFELLGQGVTLQLVSADNADPGSSLNFHSTISFCNFKCPKTSNFCEMIPSINLLTC